MVFIHTQIGDPCVLVMSIEGTKVLLTQEVVCVISE
jgi:hypothetical protein